MRKLFHLLLVVAFMLVLSERPAHAYIDPGSGSLLLQLILGGVAALWVAVRLYWRRVVGMFSRGTESDERN